MITRLCQMLPQKKYWIRFSYSSNKISRFNKKSKITWTKMTRCPDFTSD